MFKKVYFFALILLFMPFVFRAEGREVLTLWEVYNQHIRPKKFVDLTHAFYPGVPHWNGFPDEKRETLFWYEPEVGTLEEPAFLQNHSSIWVSGEPTLIRRLISLRVSEPLMRLIQKKW